MGGGLGERFFPLWTLRWELRQFNRAYRKAIREANSLSAKRELEAEEHAPKGCRFES